SSDIFVRCRGLSHFPRLSPLSVLPGGPPRLDSPSDQADKETIRTILPSDRQGNPYISSPKRGELQIIIWHILPEQSDHPFDHPFGQDSSSEIGYGSARDRCFQAQP